LMRLSLAKLVAFWLVIVFVLAIVAFYAFMPKLYKIPSNGMYPSMPTGTKLWVVTKAYKNVDDVRRGDVIVFRFINKGKLYNYIWRVIGLPGDSVTVTDSSVILNGKRLEHRQVREEPEHVIYSEWNGEVEYLVAYEKQVKASRRLEMSTTVPDGELFLLGDNRNNAADSRYHGTVRFEDVIGKTVWSN